MVRLPIDADLGFHWYVQAYNQLYKSKTRNAVFFLGEIEIHMANYHTAYKIAQASGDDIKINNNLGHDAWKLTIWFKENDVFLKKSVFSPGA